MAPSRASAQRYQTLHHGCAASVEKLQISHYHTQTRARAAQPTRVDNVHDLVCGVFKRTEGKACLAEVLQKTVFVTRAPCRAKVEALQRMRVHSAHLPPDDEMHLRHVCRKTHLAPRQNIHKVKQRQDIRPGLVYCAQDSLACRARQWGSKFESWPSTAGTPFAHLQARVSSG
jgi:hypothetical protein